MKTLKTYSEFDRLSEKDKIDYLKNAHHEEKMSIVEIADNLKTYPNKIRRTALKLGVEIASRSQSQKNLLASGKKKHPTLGTTRPAHTKEKISNAIANIWDNYTEEELKERQQMGKDIWNSKTEKEKEEFYKKGNQSVRQTAKKGSKLEHEVLRFLVKEGYDPQFHVDKMIASETLQVDIFVPELNVVIEVDGPSHIKPVWGDEALEKMQKADAKKNGLVLGAGYVMLRLQSSKSPSAYRIRETIKELKKGLDAIKKEYPPAGKRFITIKV